MTARRKITNAPSIVTLYDKDGKKVELRMTAFSDVEIAELDEWVRNKYITIARDSIPPDATQSERDETLRIAFNGASTLTWMSGQGARMMASVDGMAQIVWMGCRAQHKDVSVSQLRALMFNPVNIRESNRKFRELNTPVKKG